MQVFSGRKIGKMKTKKYKEKRKIKRNKETFYEGKSCFNKSVSKKIW